MASVTPVKIKDYPSWSFRGRGFLTAFTISVLWHFFWFFAITIVVSPKANREKPRPRLVSLGPVLDDTIFKTLVETRPQASQTFYHQLSDFSPAVELQAKTAERHLPGDVVSVPIHRRFFNSLRDMVGGFKPSPDFDVKPRFGLRRVPENLPEFTGGLEGRSLREAAPIPEYPAGFDPMFRFSEAEAQISVDAEGRVVSVKIITSSGSSQVDGFWERFLKELLFSNLLKNQDSGLQTGRARLKFSDSSGEPLT